MSLAIISVGQYNNVLALSQPVCLPLIGAAAASPGMAVKQTESVLNKSCPISQNDTTVYNWNLNVHKNSTINNSQYSITKMHNSTVSHNVSHSICWQNKKVLSNRINCL